jgi:Predicted AAA-ATPase/PD-(D/E)XK nuclease superfamily
MSRNYPIGTQDFTDVIESGAIYVDKTHFMVSLIKHSFHKNYFLSRPRRFGKSLFLNALEQVWSGNQALFKGLYIYDKIDWQKYPVIRFSLDKIGFRAIGLENALMEMVQDTAAKHQITLKKTYPSGCFEELITQLHEKYQKKVIVLIDEYDKPIIHDIEKDNVILAESNRDILKEFYGILKDSEPHLRFLFITGVSKISKVSIFSDLNQLDDLTLDTDYATICGFTEAEVRHHCATGLQDLADKEGVTVEQIMDKIRFWYDGFSWNARDFVYNPFSTMVLMQKKVFDIYWFDTGTPTFLAKLVNKAQRYNFHKLTVEKSIYNWHDLKNIDFVSVMLQTGYLTFKEHIVDDLYIIGYPNKEVENAFSKMLLGDYLHQSSSNMSVTAYDIELAFQSNDLNKGIEILTNLFKTLPYSFFLEDVERRDKKGNVTIVQRQVGENFYHAIIYLIFNILAIRMRVEILASDGRIDAVVETNTHVYLFEFKKGRKPKDAIQQIWDNQYANLYALSKKQMVCIGICFTTQKRGISGSVILNLEDVAAYLAAT